MEKEEKKVNMTIKDGDTFFAHEMSINFNPMNFILDFKNVTPRVDPRSKESLVLHMAHNVVIVDPYHAKKIHELLGKVLGDYEKDFGRIEKPKALAKYESKAKKAGKKKAEKPKAKTTTPSYMG
ncbi:DUF3467 domain-containing protein [Candidatus Woesearchaeota archaeon]|nr:DUF3467 domain-containing protein [Candidatus Woesearchaeota archaeon]